MQTVLTEKWAPVLNSEKLEPIADVFRRRVTATLLENQEKFLQEAASTTTGNIQNWDPVLISLVRRMAPKLIAYDVRWRSSFDGSYWNDFCYQIALH